MCVLKPHKKKIELSWKNRKRNNIEKQTLHYTNNDWIRALAFNIRNNGSISNIHQRVLSFSASLVVFYPLSYNIVFYFNGPFTFSHLTTTPTHMECHISICQYIFYHRHNLVWCFVENFLIGITFNDDFKPAYRFNIISTISTLSILDKIHHYSSFNIFRKFRDPIQTKQNNETISILPYAI